MRSAVYPSDYRVDYHGTDQTWEAGANIGRLVGSTESLEEREWMKLPNGEAAIVETGNLRDYCLSRWLPRGRHKARVFLSRLGMSAVHPEELRAALIEAA